MLVLPAMGPARQPGAICFQPARAFLIMERKYWSALERKPFLNVVMHRSHPGLYFSSMENSAGGQPVEVIFA